MSFERDIKPTKKSILSRLKEIHRSKSQIVGKTNSIVIPTPNPNDNRIVHSHEGTSQFKSSGFFSGSSSYQTSSNSSDVEDQQQPMKVKSSSFKRLRRLSGGIDPSKRRSVSITANEVDSNSNDLLKKHWTVERPGNRRVLIGIDDKANSERAFRWYLDYMIEPHDRVLLVHITEPCISVGVGIASARSADVKRDSKMYMRSCQPLIDSYLKRARNSGVETQVEAHIFLNWRPAEALVSAIKSLQADVIVLGSRGTVHSTGLRGLFLGSVLRYVINHSDIPVTVVPPYDVTPCAEDAQCKIKKSKSKK